MNESLQNQILGRLQGLTEIWGSTNSEWTDEQRYRIQELYMLLNPAFVVSIFTNGFPSDRIFLADIGAELFNKGRIII